MGLPVFKTGALNHSATLPALEFQRLSVGPARTQCERGPDLHPSCHFGKNPSGRRAPICADLGRVCKRRASGSRSSGCGDCRGMVAPAISDDTDAGEAKNEDRPGRWLWDLCFPWTADHLGVANAATARVGTTIETNAFIESCGCSSQEE
jgi:hypothetical protein